MESIEYLGRQLPLLGRYDTVVVGGGAAVFVERRFGPAGHVLGDSLAFVPLDTALSNPGMREHAG